MAQLTTYQICEIARKTYAINEAGMAAMFLVVGAERALLIDTGVGMTDLKEVVKHARQGGEHAYRRSDTPAKGRAHRRWSDTRRWLDTPTKGWARPPMDGHACHRIKGRKASSAPMPSRSAFGEKTESASIALPLIIGRYRRVIAHFPMEISKGAGNGRGCGSLR